jgi:hypothetical protein
MRTHNRSMTTVGDAWEVMCKQMLQGMRAGRQMGEMMGWTLIFWMRKPC